MTLNLHYDVITLLTTVIPAVVPELNYLNDVSHFKFTSTLLILTMKKVW